jgi:cytosine/adenosine deaminase-related metal-dependent hydrolase
VLPISQPPIRDGWVAVEDGRIISIGGDGDLPPGDSAPHRNARSRAGATPSIAILPGFVNAHTHLELSYLHERIPPSPSFGGWVREVMKARTEYPDPADPEILDAARRAIASARASGAALFGDISNTLVTVPLLTEAGSAAHVFYELLGFMERNAEARVREARDRITALGDAHPTVKISLAAHAPYSVSEELFRAIREDLDRHPDAVSSIHLGETPQEVELLRHGTGEIRSVLEDLGRWPSGWRPPGVGPVEYLAGLGVLADRTLAVHGVQFDAADLAHLRARGTTIVSCPRSNVHVGVGSPPLSAFYESGVPVAFGTDSLASVGDLDMFAELNEARRIAPDVAAGRLLESATLAGARALGFERDFGSLDPGKRAALLAVRIPEGVDDVEQYLVSESRLDRSWLGGW